MGGERRGQGSAHGPHVAGEREFADDVEHRQVRLHLARGRQDAQGDRQVVARAFLRQIGRGQVDHNFSFREMQAAAADRGLHPVARLAHRAFGQTHHVQAREAGHDMDFDLHRHGEKAYLGAGVDGGVAHRRALIR